MAELLLDVHLELDPETLMLERDPTQAIAELSRAEAESQCRERGAVLRHPDPRDVVVQRAMKPTTGTDVLLVATRWLADGVG